MKTQRLLALFIDYLFLLLGLAVLALFFTGFYALVLGGVPEFTMLQTQLLTGADIGVAVIEGQGPPIEIVDVTDHRNAAALLEGRIENWLDDGIRPGHITILSPMRLSESSAWLLPSRLKSRLTRVDMTAASNSPPTILTYSTVRGFKGLENRCIAVVDLDGFAAHAPLREVFQATVGRRIADRTGNGLSRRAGRPSPHRTRAKPKGALVQCGAGRLGRLC